MSQPHTISAPEAFHPDGTARFAELAGVHDDPPAWHEDALCAQTDPEAFFPEKGGSTREAKQICARCPVRTECLRDALASDTRFGVWGGLTERERRVLRRHQPAEETTDPPVPTVPGPREDQAGQHREPASPPGRSAGPGVAATLPTEPRGTRDRPGRSTSTFPDRARTAPAAAPTPGHVPEQASPRTASRSAGRRSRTKPAARPTRTSHRKSPSRTTSEFAEAGATIATVTTTPDDAEAGAAEDTMTADSAAAAVGRPRSGPPPDERRDEEPDRALRDATLLVLAGQESHPGAGDVDFASVLELVSAMASGESVAESPAEGPRPWEWRVAAVAAVVSGALTRGRAGRLMGERSQDVAHWVRRHLEGMPLIERDVTTRGSHRAGER